MTSHNASFTGNHQGAPLFALSPAFARGFYLSFQGVSPDKGSSALREMEPWQELERVPSDGQRLLEILFNLEYSGTFPNYNSSPALRLGDVNQAIQALKALNSLMHEGGEQLAQYVHEKALTLYEAATDAEDLFLARELFDNAFSFGQIEAAFFAAQVSEALAARVGFKSREGRQNLDQAEGYYRKCASAGLVRGWLQLALLKEEAGNQLEAAVEWGHYFDEFGSDPIPAEELTYLCETLREQYFRKNIQSKDITFLKGRYFLIKECQKTFKKDSEFLLWMRECCWTTKDFMVDRAKIPTLALMGLGLLYLSSPLLAYLMVIATGYLWIRHKKKSKNPDKS